MPGLDYHITYAITFHENPIMSAEIPEDHGGCDAIFLATYKEKLGNEVEYGFSGVHENGQQMETLHMFTVWLQLAGFLKENLPEGGPKDLCTATYDTYMRAIEMTKEEEEKKESKKEEEENKGNGKKQQPSTKKPSARRKRDSGS